MSEQLTTLKTTAKGKGKAGALAGLLNAGKIEFKNSDKTDKSAFEKLLTAAKKTTGVEVDKNISSKTKMSKLPQFNFCKSLILKDAAIYLIL